MKYSVYALRLRESTEVRYVGFTRFDPAARLRQHATDTTYGTPGRPIRQWLTNNDGQVIGITLCTARTEAEARAMEKGAIAALANGGHRLLNSDHVPAHLRCTDIAA